MSFNELKKDDGSKSTNHSQSARPFELVAYLHKVAGLQRLWLAHLKKHTERRIFEWQAEHLSFGYVGSLRVEPNIFGQEWTRL